MVRGHAFVDRANPGKEANVLFVLKEILPSALFRTLNSAHGATWLAIIWLPLVSQSHLFPPPTAGGWVTDTIAFNQTGSESVLTEILPRRRSGAGRATGKVAGGGTCPCKLWLERPHT